MYGGYGLSTPRGSGTSGYVMKNKAYVNPYAKAKKQNFGKTRIKKVKKSNPDIVEHEKKREVENELLVLQMQLEEKGSMSSEQIEKYIDDQRKKRYLKIRMQLTGMLFEETEEILEQTGDDREKRRDVGDDLKRFDERNKRRRMDNMFHRNLRNEKESFRVDKKKYSQDKFRKSTSHSKGVAQIRKNKLFARALGINLSSHVVGSSFEGNKTEEEKEKDRVEYVNKRKRKRDEEKKLREKIENERKRAKISKNEDDDDSSDDSSSSDSSSDESDDEDDEKK